MKLQRLRKYYPTQVEEKAKHLLEHYKHADATRVKIYVAAVMQNDEVMKFLESC